MHSQGPKNKCWQWATFISPSPKIYETFGDAFFIGIHVDIFCTKNKLKNCMDLHIGKCKSFTLIWFYIV